MKILICLLVSLSFSGFLYAQNESDTNAQSDPQCETRKVINETTGSVHVITTCVDNAPKKEITTKKNQEHSNDLEKSFSKFNDLDSQVSMAHSTYWIKLFTFAGVFIGGIGLWMLYKTLSETRNASTYARKSLAAANAATDAAIRTAEASETAERAYVLVEFECIKKTADSGNEFVEVTAWIVNAGKTPALDVTYVHGWSGYKCGNEVRGETPIGMLTAGQKVRVVDLPSSFSLNPFIGPFGDQNSVANVYVKITGYKDIFGVDGKHFTCSGNIDKSGVLRTNTYLEWEDERDKKDSPPESREPM